MKKFLFVIAIVSLVCFYWYISDFGSFSKEVYLPKKVLDISSPLNGTIDTDLLKSLSPAYE